MAEAKIDQLRYARDVLLAYDYWKREFPADLARLNPSAEALHEWANTPGNTKDFLAAVKNSSDLLQKYAPKDNTPEEFLRKERIAIADLKDRLAAAVAESQHSR